MSDPRSIVAQRLLAKRELARRRLIEFTRYTLPNYKVGWVHRDIAARLERFADAVVAEESPRLMLALPPRIGKALEINTPILTTVGWKRIVDLRPGDRVFSEKGEPTTVTGVSPVFTHRRLFRVYDGQTLQSVYADEAHEWTVMDAYNKDTNLYTDLKVVSTEAVYFSRFQHYNHVNRYALPAVEALKYAFIAPSYPCSAYTLGVFIAFRSCMLLPERMDFLCLQAELTRDGITSFADLRTLGTQMVVPLEDVVMLSEEDRLAVVQGFVDATGYEADILGWSVAIPRTPLVTRTIFTLLTSLGIPMRSYLKDVRFGDHPSVAALKHMEFVLLFKRGVARLPAFQLLLRDENPSLRSRRARGVANTRFVSGLVAVGTADFIHQPQMQFYDDYLPAPPSMEPLQPKSNTYNTRMQSVYGLTVCIEVDNPTHMFLCGHGLMPTHNSELASTRFPAWFMGHHPEMSVIAASYSADLPMGFSRKIRGLLRDEKYQAVFPDARLSPDSQAVERWATTKDGEYSAVGVGGALTGKGANVLLIDDPIKNMEEADNARLRESLLDWYQSTAYTRLAPGGGVLIINTRWSFDDLSGKLLRLGAQDPEADQFEVVDYPAEAEEFEYRSLVNFTIQRYPEALSPEVLSEQQLEFLRAPGDVLHPERFTPAMVSRFKRNLTKRIWSALYQQRPAPDEGLFFKRDSIKYIGGLPALRSGRVIATWDFAIGVKNQNDYTTCALSIQDSSDVLFVFKLLRFKRDTVGIISAMLDVARLLAQSYKHMDTVIACEDGHIYRTLLPILTREMKRERLYFTLVALTPLTDKVLRARPLQARLEMGKILFVEGITHAQATEEELLQFPVGTHDDLVDALSWNCRVALEYEPVGERGSRSQTKSWRDKLGAHVASVGSYMSA